MTRTILLGRHKAFEIQLEPGLSHSSDSPFWFEFHWSRQEDHAGLHICVAIYGLGYCGLTLYDTRHWDYRAERFEEPG